MQTAVMRRRQQESLVVGKRQVDCARYPHIHIPNHNVPNHKNNGRLFLDISTQKNTTLVVRAKKVWLPNLSKLDLDERELPKESGISRKNPRVSGPPPKKPGGGVWMWMRVLGLCRGRYKFGGVSGLVRV
jgi:hypothetical protein